MLDDCWLITATVEINLLGNFFRAVRSLPWNRIGVLVMVACRSPGED
jgi:hypothetical protein